VTVNDVSFIAKLRALYRDRHLPAENL